MQQFPLFIRFEGRKILIVGGGQVATRKVNAILNSGAEIHLVSPDATAPLAELAQHSRITHHQRTYETGEAESYWLVIAATNDASVNEQIAHDASKSNALVNVSDNPLRGDVSFASIVNRAPLQIAISTGGHSPILARLIRARIAAFIPPSYGALTQLAGDFRQQVKDRFTSLRERRRFWEQTLNGPIAQRLLKGDEAGARQQLRDQLLATSVESDGSSVQTEDSANTAKASPSAGEVYLVGAGPGDPDLLTFRALRLMHQADVVLHDRLVSDEIMSLCPSDAQFIYVGKRRADHAMPQESINETLVSHAKDGKRVLRIKGGDPFIFGRGGEEIETLAAAGVPFEVVPGITAASGCASYAGIPLTHRDHAQACVFVTGHLKQGELHLNWPHLVQPNQTVVCYMGLTALAELSQKLIQHGMPEQTPAALVERGTTQHQRVITGTVENLPALVARSNVRAPTLIIIGSVVTLREKLQWFEPVPTEQ